MKCNTCGMVYFASDSKAALEAGVIPDGAPELQDTDAAVQQPESPGNEGTAGLERDKVDGGGRGSNGGTVKKAVPRTPSFVIVAKDRTEVEFCTQKDFKRALLKWEAADKKYDCFALTLKKVSAKVDIN